MDVALRLLIERTEAAIAASSDPKKKLRLERDLASYRLTALRAESADDEDDEEDDDADEGDKAGKAAKRADMSRKKAESAKHKAKADEHRQKAAEYDDKARKCLGSEDEDDDEEAKAMRAELDTRLAASSSSGGALAALADQANMSADALSRLQRLEREAEARETRAAIQESLSTRCITRTQAVMLEKKSRDFVKDYLSMHTRPLVNTDESQALQPSPTENADIPANVLAQIDANIAALPESIKAEQKAKLRADMINSRRASVAGGSNGRY